MLSPTLGCFSPRGILSSTLQVREEVWERRYQQTNDFERMLAEEGTTIVKFYLHIARAEQAARLQDRLDDPAKHWEFSPADLAERKHWDTYQEAYEAMLSRTSTAWAPGQRPRALR